MEKRKRYKVEVQNGYLQMTSEGMKITYLEDSQNFHKEEAEKLAIEHNGKVILAPNFTGVVVAKTHLGEIHF